MMELTDLSSRRRRRAEISYSAPARAPATVLKAEKEKESLLSPFFQPARPFVCQFIREN